MMQLHTFPQGGFVAHKVQLSGRAYPVNRASNLWARLSGRSAIIIANHSRAIGREFCGTITKGF